ncbi:MAG TPA: response regulator [Alkalispirochaeta sp.]|nr:response regulator [Alkalispirochaeta sp.]
MKILLVDDEALPLQDMKMALEPTGFQIETTTRPKEAIEMYRQERFDAVVSDVRMPEIDGMTLLKTLRQMDESARVIIVTAYGDLETAKEAINNRAYAFFGKPVSFPELIQTLKDIETEQDETSTPDVKRLQSENKRLKAVYQELLDEVKMLRNDHADPGSGET